jgi:hypothetical protein
MAEAGRSDHRAARHSHRHSAREVVAWLFILAAAACAGPGQAGLTLLATGDTEGHLGPCNSCPAGSGLGGMSRRATVAREARAATGNVVLADAGNFLWGTDSLDSGGRSIVAAYNALGYDAVNVSCRDFRLGRDATLALLKDAKFAVVSANLCSEGDGAPLFSPFVVREVGGERIAFLGASEPPADLDLLPHLKDQLAGIRIRPAADSLAEWLPKAKAASDRVVLLYYGPPSGLRALRSKFGAELSLICAGGIRPEQVPSDPGATVVGTEPHGKSVSRVTVGAGGPPEVAPVRVSADVPQDPQMQQLLAAYATPGPAASPPVAANASARPQPGAAQSGATQPAPDRPETTTAATSRSSAPAAPATSPGRSASGGFWKALLRPRGTSPSTASASQPSAGPLPPSAPPPSAPAPTSVPAVQPAVAPQRVAAKQPREPKGLAGVGLTQEQVNAAIDRGADFLWNYVKAEREKSGQKFGHKGEYDLLNGLALVEAGAHKRYPEFDAQLRAYLPQVHPHQIGVYGCGVFCMLLETYGDGEFQWQLNRAARYLFEGQSAEASWQYYPTVPEDALKDPRFNRALQVWGGRPTDGSPAEQWRRLTEPDKHEGGDNSVTQYALLGLHAASRAGVEVPQDAWKRVLELYKSRQNPDGSWGYVTAGSAPSGSMTCAGAYGVALCRYHLGLGPHPEDESIERGLAWLSQHFSVTDNPGSGTYHYYYLYALERLGRTLDTEFIGPNEWYPLGARFLVDAQQPDGSWIEPGAGEKQPDLSTSFALLFLTRRTASPAQARATGGKGTLKTGIAQPVPPRVYLIFDCSGSMLVESNGTSKFDLARAALGEILDSLPAQSQLALRVYGHRKTARDPGADEDTELLVPMGKLERADLDARISRLRARGKTPLARSIAEAAKDLAGSTKDNPCALILITDGGEDTRPPGDPVAAARDLARVPGVTLHVVGFDIGRDDWGRQLRAIARAGGGRYWPASDATDLRGELRAAVLRAPETYAVIDANGRRVYDGRFGQPVTLPEGQYTLATTFAGKRFQEAMWVNTGSTTAALFDADKIDVTAPAPGEATATTPADTPPPTAGGEAGAARPKFCTHCGKPLSPGAKFCTHCGTRVGP